MKQKLKNLNVTDMPWFHIIKCEWAEREKEECKNYQMSSLRHGTRMNQNNDLGIEQDSVVLLGRTIF